MVEVTLRVQNLGTRLWTEMGTYSFPHPLHIDEHIELTLLDKEGKPTRYTYKAVGIYQAGVPSRSMADVIAGVPCEVHAVQVGKTVDVLRRILNP